MYYQVNDVRLLVESEGNNHPALIFLHFWGGSSRTWKQVSDLLKKDYRCIRMDLRGWGESDKPQTGYDIQSLADDVSGLISQLQLNNYILVGHSMGGKIAQAIAAKKPAGLKKLILVAPSPAVSTILPAEMVLGMENAYTSLDNINQTIDHVFNAPDLTPTVRQTIVEDMQRHNTASRLGWPAAALTEDVSAGLSSIYIPTLIIAGENDIVDSPSRLQAELVAIIPGSRMVVIPRVGHLIMVQQPEKVAELIHDFCRSEQAAMPFSGHVA
ncbi:alpha/beta fold hydrolase [Chitinophaga filiformis]|uniref:Alpha/beta hydrolase n=1 Tax=Chitinophaga filiformis TaxID=104663 RepID=A0ABY4I4M7_CHIFI|nr:alpha/beta hydrolase [Chitinophaga filiformis]UPK71028.1 alpha/beta hydrolase [Chitinophaga filiformis]